MIKRILVTGASGFLGSHLCNKLLERGDTVIGIDNFSSSDGRNINELYAYSNFKFINHDITLPIFEEVDMIYNLACPASPIHYQKDPIQTTRTCVLGSMNMLELAKSNNALILQASTSEVYGDPVMHPQKESYWGNVNPIGIRSCYDEGKRCAETLFFDYHRVNNLSTKVARIFNTYGPNMHPCDGRVVSNFIIQALQNNNITIYGSGMQTRSFCYVNDTIDALVKIMDNDNALGPINIGNPNEFTILELAEKIINLTSSKSKIIFEPLPEDDPRQRRPDINLAKSLLGWEPTIDIDEGLLLTIDYFQDLLTTASF